jgi:hypothetical protein
VIDVYSLWVDMVYYSLIELDFLVGDGILIGGR